MNDNPAKNLMETLLHPVRMRIMIALAGSSGLTPLQMSEQLADIPQATLYRHIGRLLKSGFVTVVDERRIRGTLEKVYALNSDQPAGLDAQALSGLSKEDHLHFFTSFAMNLIDQFSRYLNSAHTVDFEKDGVGYTQVALSMTDEELASFASAINTALIPYAGTREAPGSKKRIFTTVLFPGQP